jgi:hypothetical protein
MKNALCILVLFVLSACAAGRKQDVTGGAVDRTKPLCGSRLTLEKAVKDADLIIHAHALEVPLGEQTEEGVKHYHPRFRVISALKGGVFTEEIRIGYVCMETDLNERGVEKGEEVILFVKMQPHRHAIKIIPATKEALEKTKELLK